MRWRQKWKRGTNVADCRPFSTSGRFFVAADALSARSADALLAD